jgi:hypothetical protein
MLVGASVIVVVATAALLLVDDVRTLRRRGRQPEAAMAAR